MTIPRSLRPGRVRRSRPRSDRRQRSRNLRVVRRAFCERFLEDRRIRCHPDQCVILDELRQPPIMQHRAVDVVEPDRLAGLVKALQRIGRHRQLSVRINASTLQLINSSTVFNYFTFHGALNSFVPHANRISPPAEPSGAGMSHMVNDSIGVARVREDSLVRPSSESFG